jgi:succinyl-diaminopimelate desuccinylase
MSETSAEITIDELERAECLSETFVVEVLSSLVRANSINPGVFEVEMAERVQEWLKPTGAAVTVVEFEPGRPSVAAVFEGTGDGPRLVMNGHMDTHPLDEESLWTVDPFGAEIKDGYLYGRGACDMKAGLTSQIAVAHFVAAHRERLKGTLVLQFAAGEERGEPGTLSMVQAGLGGDFGIVTEPTELRVATAERGAAWFIIRVKGRSIHSSRAHLGLNPIWRLRPVLDVLEEYERDVKALKHPLLPGGSCTPGIVRAGIKENSVPDSCEIVIDRRLLPGETVDRELEALRTRLAVIKESDPEFEFEVTRYPAAFEPTDIDPGSPFARTMLGAAKAVTGAPQEPWGTPFSSDIGDLVGAGIEAVTFGAGNVAECHCADERVEIAQVRDASRVLALATTQLLM